MTQFKFFCPSSMRLTRVFGIGRPPLRAISNQDSTAVLHRKNFSGSAMTSQEDLADPSYSVYHVSPSIPTPHASAEVPALAFGLYKVPNGDEGVRIISDAILRAGYRHLDSASIYGNEKTLGRALSECCGTTKEKISAGTSQSKTVKRSDLFIASKVWNDAQREGRPAVRRSVEQSLDDLGLEYLDVCYSSKLFCRGLQGANVASKGRENKVSRD